VKIAVTVKQVPEPSAPPRLGPDFAILRDGDLVLDAGDECGIEVALQLKEAHGGEVVLVSMGPASARDAVRKGLSMGADRGIVVADDQLQGADALLTAQVLAAVLRAEAPDLVICGTESYDGSTGLVPPMLAELLDVPQLTFATSVEVVDGTVSVRRRVDAGTEVLEARLPALATVTAAIAEPRYPTLKSIMAAKSKQVAQLALADLEVVAGSRVETVEEVVDAATRQGGEIVEGDVESAVARILELLVAAQVV
jgi:electron transfer flavoprotein beta subunit